MIIIDYKTGAINPCTELQLAAQALLAQDGYDIDGNKFIERENKTAFEISLFHPVYRFAGTLDSVLDDGKKEIKLYALHLSEDGKFKLTEHSKNLRKNIQVFLSFLTTFKWKKERNL